MATREYHEWVADGRPWKLARPAREMKDRMVAAGWPAKEIGTLGADTKDQLQNDPPKDHCPFSSTGWPVKHPYPYVTALDYMHRPEKGLDCNKLFAYRIAEARAGRTPWTKYLIWKATLYHARDGFLPQESSKHFDHIHESIRSDWVDKSIGDWSPLPEEDDDMGAWDVEPGKAIAFTLLRNEAGGAIHVRDALMKQALDRIEAAAAAERERDRAALAAIQVLTESIRGATIDTGSILRRIDEAASQTNELVTALQAELARLRGEVEELTAERDALKERVNQ